MTCYNKQRVQLRKNIEGDVYATGYRGVKINFLIFASAGWKLTINTPSAGWKINKLIFAPAGKKLTKINE